ncbi:MAG: amidohydrolase family protein, partial [Longimicrobiales bacterium]|nr:amidohydrolase family protein [Longimicrobiales bacterium]
DQGVLVVRDGRIAAVGPSSEIDVPAGAQEVDLSGRTVVPGIINAHGHVGSARGLETGPEVYTRENILDQLGVNARYGVTTVVSLGGDGPEGVRVRDEQNQAGLDRARLFVAGPVLNPDTPEEAVEQVVEVAEMGVDWVKIRIDDFLGRGQKMPPDVYGAVIEAAHERGLPVAVHIVYLEDAIAALEAGADLIAHSIRDAPVSRELLDLMRDRDVCLVPTLAREVSTFVYAERPDFFDDPFFRREVDSEVMETLQEPERQAAMAESESARWYREHLPLAQENMARMHEAGVRVALGTDSGPAARFQGYFEHMEMELMAEAGMSAEDILRSATGVAASCMGLDEELGTLEEGKWADFVVLREDPLADIRNMRSIDQVRVAGNRVSGSHWEAP